MALPLSIKPNKIKLFSLMNKITQYLHCIIRIQISYTFIIFQIPRIISFKNKIGNSYKHSILNFIIRCSLNKS